MESGKSVHGQSDVFGTFQLVLALLVLHHCRYSILFLQTLLMDVHLLPLVARKVFGLDSDTTLNVSDATPSKATNSLYNCFHSHSASSPFEDGYAMCHA